MSAPATTKQKPPPPAIIHEAIYVYKERLGMLCEGREPTPAQLAMAEADYWKVIARWRSGELKE